MRLRLTWPEYAGSFGGFGLVVLALLTLIYGFSGRPAALLVAPVLFVGGVVLLRWVDRHTKGRLHNRTDAIRQTLLKSKIVIRDPRDAES